MDNITAEQFELEGWVEDLGKGDPRAQRLFYHAFKNYLKSTIMPVLRQNALDAKLPAEEIEELVEETLGHVLLKINHFNPGCGTFRTWAGTVARNHAVDWIRKAARHLAPVRGDTVMDTVTDSGIGSGGVVDPVAVLLRDDTSLDEALFRFRQERPEYARDVDILFARLALLREGKKDIQKEVAARIGCSVSTVNNHLGSWKRGPFLVILGAALRAEGFAVSGAGEGGSDGI